MKKLKTTQGVAAFLKLFTIIIMVLACMAGCKKNDGNGNGNGNGTDFNDKKNAFVIIDDVKYNLYDEHTVQDLLDAGYTVDPKYDVNQKYDASEMEGTCAQTFYMYKDGREYFEVEPRDWSSHPGALKNWTISAFYINVFKCDASTVGGLNKTYSKEDVMEVFGGKPSSQNIIMLLYDFKDHYFHFNFRSDGRMDNITVGLKVNHLSIITGQTH